MRNLTRGLLPALMLALLPLAAPASVAVGISVNFAPPALPVYVQPEIPAPGYIWTPGFWAWGPGGYYWVPGTWVLPPAVGFLWTPGYWGWGGGAYFWHAGYWGPHVGFYGGINYGWRGRSETCITGMVLSILSHFRLDDSRLEIIANHLLKAEMTDGGWNCRRDLGATHASMHTTISVDGTE